MGNLLPSYFTSDSPTKNSASEDLLTKAMGAFGKYQLMITLMILLTKMPIGLNQMSIIFLAPANMKFKCDGVVGACPCDDPEWDTSIFKSSIQMDFNLICERKYLCSINQCLFQLGILIGSILFGMASDRFGRRMPLLVAIVLQTVSGACAAWAPTFAVFTICRFALGFCCGGSMVVSFVHLMEFIGTKYRSTIAVIYQFPFNIGLMMLPLIAYFIREWRKFQLVITIPSLLQFIMICFLPESPRWLLSNRKTEEAIAIVETVAATNKLRVDTVRYDVQAFQAEAESDKLKRGHLFDFLRYPKMLRNLLFMAYNWFACSYYFYGISQYTGHLHGDIFLNVAMGTFLAFVGAVLAFPFLRYAGRRNIVLINTAISFSAMVLLAVIPQGGVLALTCACLGLMSSFCVFVIIYLFTSEMFPTVVRNSAIGFCSMCARIGSILAPLVVDLDDIAPYWPPICFAVPSFFAWILCFFLPETAGRNLTITLDQGEEFAKSG